MKGSILDIDRGWRKIQAELIRLTDQGFVTVGIQGAEAQKTHEGGLTNVQLGNVHEYGATIQHPGGTPYLRGPTAGPGQARFISKATADGLPRAVPVTKAHEITIPERSFMRATLDANRSKYADLITRLLDRVVRGKLTTDQLLGLLGARVVADIKRRIRSRISPALKASTIRRKGSSTPLIDTGGLVNAITWAVRRRDAEGNETVRTDV